MRPYKPSFSIRRRNPSPRKSPTVLEQVIGAGIAGAVVYTGARYLDQSATIDQKEQEKKDLIAARDAARNETFRLRQILGVLKIEIDALKNDKAALHAEIISLKAQMEKERSEHRSSISFMDSRLRTLRATAWKFSARIRQLKRRISELERAGDSGPLSG